MSDSKYDEALRSMRGLMWISRHNLSREPIEDKPKSMIDAVNTALDPAKAYGMPFFTFTSKKEDELSEDELTRLNERTQRYICQLRAAAQTADNWTAALARHRNKLDQRIINLEFAARTVVLAHRAGLSGINAQIDALESVLGPPTTNKMDRWRVADRGA